MAQTIRGSLINKGRVQRQAPPLFSLGRDYYGGHNLKVCSMFLYFKTLFSNTGARSPVLLFLSFPNLLYSFFFPQWGSVYLFLFRASGFNFTYAICKRRAGGTLCIKEQHHSAPLGRAAPQTNLYAMPMPLPQVIVCMFISQMRFHL